MASKVSRVALVSLDPSVRGVHVVVATLAHKAPRVLKDQRATKAPRVLALVAPQAPWVVRASVVSQAKMDPRVMLVHLDLRALLDQMD